MPFIKFKYQRRKSPILGIVLRPIVSIEIYSKSNKVVIDDVLADTGADITLLLRNIGELLVDDITKGKYVEIKGVVPSANLISYIHCFKIKLGEKVFTAPVAIADSDNVPPILGRYKALDLFNVRFNKGKEVIFEEPKKI
jgi:predicted aspartyl protease